MWLTWLLNGLGILVILGVAALIYFREYISLWIAAPRNEEPPPSTGTQTTTPPPADNDNAPPPAQP